MDEKGGGLDGEGRGVPKVRWERDDSTAGGESLARQLLAVCSEN